MGFFSFLGKIFRRKPSRKLPIEERAQPYLEYRRSLSELDFMNESDIGLAVYCLGQDTNLLQDFTVEEPDHLSFLKRWIKLNYANYLACVQNGLEHSDLLMLYLTLKFTDLYQKKDKLGKLNKGRHDGELGLTQYLTLSTSYDKKMVINYQYETNEGETISYFDQVLGMPTKLVAKANVRLKFVDAQKFVQKVDVDLAALDLDSLAGCITTNLNRVVRDTILSFIAQKNLSFYDLPQYFTVLNKGISVNLRTSLGDYGMEAVEFVLSKIAVPNNAEELLREQFYTIAKAERFKDHEHRMANAALDLYERKAAIHEKYPNFPLTLTEAEKDFALKRYLKRMGEDTELKGDQIIEKRLPKRKFAKGLAAKTDLSPEKFDYIPETASDNKHSKIFRIFYGIGLGLIYFLALASFSVSVVTGIIGLCLATFITGLATFFGYKYLKGDSQTEFEQSAHEDVVFVPETESDGWEAIDDQNYPLNPVEQAE